MKTRLISAGIGIIVCVAVFWLCELIPFFICAVLAIVNTLLCGEYLSAKNIQKQLLLFIPSLVFAFSAPMVVITNFAFIPLYIFALILAIFSVGFHKDIHTDDLMFTFGGVVLISLSIMSFSYTVFTHADHASFWIVLILAIPWLSDSFAYFIGSAIGKHQLSPVISPKKSVEGAIAGLIGGTLSGVVVGLVYMLIYGNVKMNFPVLIGLGVINSVISIFGDLMFSVVKRKCSIKDFGSILPGHGGLLDRFDSVIYCVPVVFFASQYFTIIS